MPVAKAIKSIGQLNRRIEIVREVRIKDEDGFVGPPTLESVRECWAAVSDGTYRANEHFTAAVGHLVSTVDFTIRYKSAAGVVEGMYVLYNGRKHRILKFYDAEHARDYIVLNTTDTAQVEG